MFFWIETLFLGIVAGIVAAGIFFIFEQKVSYNRFLALLSNEINNNYKKMKGGHEKGYFFKDDLEKAKERWKLRFKEKKPPQSTEWIGKENATQGYDGYILNYLDFDSYNLFINKGLDLFLRYNSKDNIVYSLKTLYHNKKDFSRNTQKIEELINQTLSDYSQNYEGEFNLNLNYYPPNLRNMLLYEIKKNPHKILPHYGNYEINHKILLKCCCNIFYQLDCNLNAEMDRYSHLKDIYQKKYSFWDMICFYMGGEKMKEIKNYRELMCPAEWGFRAVIAAMLLLILARLYPDQLGIFSTVIYYALLAAAAVAVIIQFFFFWKFWKE